MTLAWHLVALTVDRINYACFDRRSWFRLAADDTICIYNRSLLLSIARKMSTNQDTIANTKLHVTLTLRNFLFFRFDIFSKFPNMFEHTYFDNRKRIQCFILFCCSNMSDSRRRNESEEPSQGVKSMLNYYIRTADGESAQLSEMLTIINGCGNGLWMIQLKVRT